ncbi:hypothetical protein TWF481_005299 [Arthrobotrys musiformis]|uniref:Uncharacterized protein n=1 Tax=Arthrobotrys musiformis TaxID=47236 RepID=A0AAV9WDB0_9PEZI
MSTKKTNRDLLDVGRDIKRMSADNITPPDTASKPYEEPTSTSTNTTGGSSTSGEHKSSDRDSVAAGDSAPDEQAGWGDKSGRRE